MVFLGEWHEENMEINYVHEIPRAVMRQEHAATIRPKLEETLGTFSGYFYVTLFFNEAVPPSLFLTGIVSRTSTCVFPV